MKEDSVEKNMIGAYGPWAAALLGDKPGKLSFRNPRFTSVGTWRKQALAKTRELMAIPEYRWKPRAKVVQRLEHEGLSIERLRWQLPYGPETHALFLKPKNAKGRLPGVIALHDHGGSKYFGVQKITRTGEALHPMIVNTQKILYGDVGWANEIAKRGYAVLVHDAFLFGNRRARYEDVSDVLTCGRAEPDPTEVSAITEYNSWTGGHEHIVAKSLTCAGTTWPGVFLREDQCALDYLCTRSDVDASRIACGGLSGGGLRTVMLAGIDHRIKAAFPVGLMSCWRDFLLDICYTHTWMIYVPLLPQYLDFPEILGLRVPLPTFVLNDEQDEIFTLRGMKRADQILKQVYKKAGAAKNYRCQFYPGGHKFDLHMQRDAFDWVDKQLGTSTAS
jgi:dienelactone hydrolase